MTSKPRIFPFLERASSVKLTPETDPFVFKPLIAYFLIRNIISRLDPEAQQKEEARQKARAASQKLDGILANKSRESSEDGSEYDSSYRQLRKEDLVLTPYEQTIAMEVVAPEEIPVTFEGM